MTLTKYMMIGPIALLIGLFGFMIFILIRLLFEDFVSWRGIKDWLYDQWLNIEGFIEDVVEQLPKPFRKAFVLSIIIFPFIMIPVLILIKIGCIIVEILAIIFGFVRGFYQQFTRFF